MDIVPLTVQYYETNSGQHPFRDWFFSLDRSVQRIIDKRLLRVSRGLLGDCEHFGGGLWELKIDTGPGYRIYFGREGSMIVILLNGGDKDSQSSDIETARTFWSDHLRRTRE